MKTRGATNPVGTERVLKEENGRGVYLVRDESGRRTLVKRWPATPWELFKCGLGIAQAQRQLRGARRLSAAGVATPAARGRARLVRAARLVIEIRLDWIEGESLLERLTHADDAEQRRLAGETTETLRRIAAAGLFHRDAKLSNFIVSSEGLLVAIDPVGVRRSRDVAEERERSRASLACELSATERARCAEFLRGASGA
ncbi:MAG: hypothetical protein SGJ09_03810 [Phycisphaerae bacterium]|nr:hypothetical protein [Phycisphaerae bacterium]